MNLLNIVATLTLNDKDYKSKLKEDTNETKKDANKTDSFNKNKMRSFLKVIAVVTALVVALVKVTKATITYGNSVSQGVNITDMSTEAYQKWLLTAQSVGATQSDLNSAVSSFSDILTSASNGEADATIALDELGLSYSDFQDLAPEEQFKLIVEALQNMTDSTKKTQLEQTLFGSSATALTSILSDQSTSVDDLWQTFTDLGVVMTDADVNASANLSSALNMLTVESSGLRNNLVTLLYPAISGIITFFQDLITMINQNKGLRITILTFLAALVVGIDAVAIANATAFGWIQLIIAGVAAVIVGITELYTHWSEVSKWFSDSWNAIVNWVQSGLSSINKWFSNLWNGLVSGFKAFVNFFIDGMNSLISGLNKISFTMPDWLGGKHFGIDIPLIPRLQRGKDFIPSDNYPAYLDYGERVLTKKENERYSALGGSQGIETLVNGIGGAVKGNSATKTNISVIVRIGDKEFKDYTYKVVNDSMKQKGLQSLRKVGSYD